MVAQAKIEMTACRAGRERTTKRDPWAGLRQEALSLVKREELERSAFGYRISPVRAMDRATLEAGSISLHVPAFAPASGKITAVAAAVCTLGPALGARVTSLFAERRPRLALALDALGTEMLFRLGKRVHARIGREARRDGLNPGIEISPGDPGMDIDQQANVVVLADAPGTGIVITPAGMLAPAMSLSFVLALGRHLRASGFPGRCERCPSKVRCAIRRH